MKLNPITIEALEHKMSIANNQIYICLEDGEDAEVVDNWRLTADQCDKAIEKGTADGLKENPLAIKELMDYVPTDDSNETRKINIDLCRSGCFEVFDPESVSTRRLKTMTVDGVKYCI